MGINVGWLLAYGLFSSALACGSSQGDVSSGLWGLLIFFWFSAGMIYVNYGLGLL